MATTSMEGRGYVRAWYFYLSMARLHLLDVFFLFFKFLIFNHLNLAPNFEPT